MAPAANAITASPRFCNDVNIPNEIPIFSESDRIGVNAHNAGGNIENDNAIKRTPIHGVHSTKPRSKWPNKHRKWAPIIKYILKPYYFN